MYKWTLQEFMEKKDSEGGIYSLFMWGGKEIEIIDNPDAQRAWVAAAKCLAFVEYYDDVISKEAGE